MSERESDNLEGLGYFLPEDSQLRLKKLCDHMRFLVQLAQPRTWDEQQERAPEVYVGELAICMEVLAEQADLVLEEVSWPARRETLEGAPGPVIEATPEAPDEAGERYAFGVSLDQIDTLDRLIQMISAHGDVLATAHAAELADHTLPLLGQAIHDAAKTVRDVLDQVEAQRLRQERSPRAGVGEKRTMYGAGLQRLVASRPSLSAWRLLVGKGQGQLLGRTAAEPYLTTRWR